MAPSGVFSIISAERNGRECCHVYIQVRLNTKFGGGGAIGADDHHFFSSFLKLFCKICKIRITGEKYGNIIFVCPESGISGNFNIKVGFIIVWLILLFDNLECFSDYFIPEMFQFGYKIIAKTLK